MDDNALIQSLTAKVRILENLVADLARQVCADRDRIEQATAAEEILRRAGSMPSSAPPRRPHPHPHLRVVKGAALLTAGRWLVRSRAHKVVTMGAVLAAASGAALAPDVIAPVPAAVGAPQPVPPAAPAPVTAAPLPPSPVPAPGRSVHRRDARRDDARRDARGRSPSPSASPAPSLPAPEPPSPLPAPVPSVTPPVPSCPPLPLAACKHRPRATIRP